MHDLLSSGSRFMRAMSRTADLILLNLLYLLTCAPIFTIGAANTALYTVCFRFGTDREEGLFRSYFRAFRDNFRQATILWLFFLLFGTAACVNIFLFYSMGGVMHYAFLLFLAALAMVGLLSGYSFPLLSQFDNDLKSTLKNGLIMGIAYLPRSILIVAFNVLPLAVYAVNFYVFLEAGFLWVFLYFSAAAYINCFLLKKVFAPYLPEEKEEEEYA